MLPLHCKGQTKPLNGKGHLRRIIIESKEIEFADHCLDTSLQLPHTLLLPRIVLDDMRNNFLADANLLKEIDLTQRCIHQVALCNYKLLLYIEALYPNIVHAVAENGIDLLVIIVTEDE